MKRILFPGSLRWMLVPTVFVLLLPRAANAGQSWQVTLGAQSKDAAKQAMAFLPNELCIYAGDNITWTT